jgi:FkbM family methyltransferase
MSKHFLLKVRPAPVASFLAAVLRLNKRRLVRSKHATLFIDPVSNFGAAILKGEYEPKMREVLRRYLSPGGVFIDLGANEGYFSVLASDMVGSTGTVVAIEPQSRLQHVIYTNLQVNDCFNVRVIRCAVSNKTGKVRLSLAPKVNTGSSIFRPTKYSLPTEEVRSFCLSDLIYRLGLTRCDLMKVDIEGAEYDVFLSAAEILRKGVFQNIALEIHRSILEHRGLSADDLHKHMVECGYELHTDLGNWVYSFDRKNCRESDGR